MNNYNPNIHRRKSIRLKGYDYSQAGLYFITICIQNRTCFFGTIENHEMKLNDAGIMIEKWYYELENKFGDIKCHEMVVMPNHFHCIIENVGADLRVCPDGMDVSKPDVCEMGVAKTNVSETDVSETKVSETNVSKMDVSETDVIKTDVSKTIKSVSEKLGEHKSVSEKLGEHKSVSEILGEHESVSEILGEHKSVSEKLGEHKSVSEILGEHKSVSEILGEHKSVPEILGEHHSVSEILGEHAGSPLHRVVGWFKTMTTNEYIRGVKTLGWERFDGKLWQRNYYEHIIRNQKSYETISKYIIENPAKWDHDTLK